MKRTTIIVALCHVFLLAPLASAHAEHHGPDERTITVTGQGVARAEPDRVRISLRVETRAKTAREASQKNAASADAVIRAVKATLADAGTVSTQGYQLTAEYEYDKAVRSSDKTRTLIGYLAVHTLRIVARDLTVLGGVIDAAVSQGATGADAIEFYREDLAPARREALLAAGKAAHAEAQAVADSLGVTLGELRNASSTASQPITPRYARTMMVEQAVATPIEPGSIDVAVTVTAVFAVR